MNKLFGNFAYSVLRKFNIILLPFFWVSCTCISLMNSKVQQSSLLQTFLHRKLLNK
jgi:hypothetical protein